MTKHRLLFAALIISIALPAMAQSKAPSPASAVDGSKELFLTWAASSQDYALFVPANPSGKPLPVVMYLHGAGNYPGPTYRSFWIIDALNRIEPCAVFLPHHPYNEADQGAGWGGTYDADFRGSLKEALSELDAKIKQFGLDSERQYAYGDSMGGEAVYQLAAKLPGRFAGLIPIAGYTEIKNAAEMAQTAIWMVYSAGDMDWNVADSSRNIYKAILAAGGTRVKFTEYDSGGTGMSAHMYAIDTARGDPKFLSWLLIQRKRR
jgi:predicted peptidase